MNNSLSFNEFCFLQKLSPWLGDCFSSLEFFYRDTDADIDVKKLYKPGHFIRTDCPLAVTRKLLRPVHSIRFLIAARRFLPFTKLLAERNPENRLQFREDMIPAGSNFLVVDVQNCGGLTQIVLLHFPHGAMLLAKKFKIRFSKFKASDSEGVDLAKAAEYDLQKKLSQSVHGYSLDSEWCSAMYQPVGCNSNLELNPLVMKQNSSLGSSPEIRALRYLQDCDEGWKEENFTGLRSEV